MSLSTLRWATSFLILFVIILIAPAYLIKLKPAEIKPSSITPPSEIPDFQSVEEMKSFVTKTRSQMYPNENYRARVAENLAATLNNRGWTKLRANLLTQACPYFRQSVELFSHEKSLRGLATCLITTHEFEEARSTLLKIPPENRNGTTWKLLSQLATTTDEKISLLKEGNRRLPNDETLRKSLQAHVEWTQRESQFLEKKIQQMSLFFPKNLPLETRSFVESTFEETMHTLRSHWPVDKLANGRVFFYQAESTAPLGQPQTRGADIKINLPTTRDRNAKRNLTKDIAHEITHQILDHISSGSLPEWLHEGLALWTEGHWLDHEKLRSLYRKNMLPDYQQVFTWVRRGPHEQTFLESENILSEVSLALVDDLIKKKGFPTVRTWIETLQPGMSRSGVEESFQSAFNVSILRHFQDTVIP